MTKREQTDFFACIGAPAPGFWECRCKIGDICINDALLYVTGTRYRSAWIFQNVKDGDTPASFKNTRHGYSFSWRIGCNMRPGTFESHMREELVAWLKIRYPVCPEAAGGEGHE